MTPDSDSKPLKLWNRNFISVTTANFLLFFSFYLLLPVLPLYLLDNFQASRQMVGIILSGYTLTALLIRPFGGYMVDSFDRKRTLLICYFAFFALFAGYIVAGTLLMFAIVRGLHGFAFGAVTVANSTVAIDVMPSTRRGEGIGYYGVANSLAMVIGPSLSMWMYDGGMDVDWIFTLSLCSAALGWLLDTTLRLRPRELMPDKERLSFDRFFLLNALPESLLTLLFAFAYSIMSTYIAVYARVEAGVERGSGLFFIFLATGLILTRIISGRWVRRGLLTRNIGVGILLAIAGFALMLAWRSQAAFFGSALILGAGYGMMCPAFQTTFISMAPASRRGTANSTYLTSWDVGAGAGILIGGFVAQRLSYHAAYTMAMTMCAIGLALFIAQVSRHINTHKLT
ncbi:MAG: MFS transporter [Muribaculaceae bacterium]|nr:MFS transporter [Muribaculaceae bacterium]